MWSRLPPQRPAIDHIRLLELAVEQRTSSPFPGVAAASEAVSGWSPGRGGVRGSEGKRRKGAEGYDG